MLFSLDFLVFIVIFVLTLTLLLVNYVAYLTRRRRYAALYAVGALLLGGFVIGVFLGPVMLGLAEQYGPVSFSPVGDSRLAGHSC